jgi:hypothetical protein
MMSGLAGTMMSGMAFGTGSAMASRALDSVMGTQSLDMMHIESSLITRNKHTAPITLLSHHPYISGAPSRGPLLQVLHESHLALRTHQAFAIINLLCTKSRE